MANLSAISMALCFATEVGQDAESLLEQDCMSFVAPTWQQYNMDDAFWATKIAQYTPSLAEVDADSLQQTFVQSVQDSPQYVNMLSWAMFRAMASYISVISIVVIFYI